MTYYNMFTTGISAFYSDMKKFFAIIKLVNNNQNGIKVLNRKEMDLYYRVPRDMMKVSPILLLSTLPFSYYVILPLAFMFPKVLLTHHFWTEEQKKEFADFYLQRRLKEMKYFVDTLRAMSRNFSSTNPMKLHLTNIVFKMAAFEPISPDDILDLKPLCLPDGNLHLDNMQHIYTIHMLKFFDLHRGLFRRLRLRDHARLLRAMDYCIVMEGGVHNMSDESLKFACVLRGLNTNDVSREHQINYMHKWIEVSQAVDDDCLSLLLHAAIFYGRVEHSNLALLNKRFERRRFFK